MSSVNPASNVPVTLEAVYYVESPDMPIGHIAIRPKIDNKRAEWDDTSNGMYATLDEKSPHFQQLSKKPGSVIDRVDFVFRNHKHATLQYLTLELYNEKLKSKSVGNPTFSSTEELQQYYLNTDFYRYE